MRGNWLRLTAILALGLCLAACSQKLTGPVIVYAAQDQVYAEPILKKFTRETGIEVKAVYDSEAVKTVGLANRLLAEAGHPQCDVFWGNEEMRTRQLALRGVFREKGCAAFGFRSRRIVVNTNKLTHFNVRTTLSLEQLGNPQWRGKVALAYPLMGTTAAHFHALRQKWGDGVWEKWCRALAANRPFIVDGNSAVVNLVGRGEAFIGLTDSDDIAAGQRENLPLIALPITADTLLIPNTVGIVNQCPHPSEAEKLFRFLQRPDVIGELAEAGALEGSAPGLRPHITVDWPTLLRDLEQTNEKLKTIFRR